MSLEQSSQKNQTKVGGKQKFVRDVFLADRYDTSRSTIWRWCRLGLLPQPIKIAGSSRFDLAACDQVFDKGGVDEAA